MLFRVGAKDLTGHKMIPAGEYAMEAVPNGQRVWYTLPGEDWGNAAMCWEALQETKEAQTERQFQKVFAPIARMHEAVTKLLTGTPRRQSQMQARELLKQANRFIRQEQWEQALPILENAVKIDPEYYEATYRLVQAARRSRNQATSAQVLREVLRQNRWSEDEKFMLEKGTDEWMVQAGCGRGEF